MKTTVVKGLLIWMLCAVSAGLATRAEAGDWPMTPGDFWEMTGVHLKDGGALSYATFLGSNLLLQELKFR